MPPARLLGVDGADNLFPIQTHTRRSEFSVVSRFGALSGHSGGAPRSHVRSEGVIQVCRPMNYSAGGAFAHTTYPAAELT